MNFNGDNTLMFSKYESIVRAVVLTSLAAIATSTNAAESDQWHFEFTPYFWMAGIDADVSVRNHENSVDASFNDILDNLDMSAAFLATAQYNSWVTWLQVDYLDMSTDFSRDSIKGEIATTLTMTTLGFGYQFPGWNDKQTIDVLLGVRHLSLDNDFKIKSPDLLAVDISGKRHLTDPVIIVRPSYQISEKWRFNPTFSYGGGGDSDRTYELQPQLQYQAWKNGAIRFGYRKLGYDIDTENGNGFDGDFQGPLIGIGLTF